MQRNKYFIELKSTVSFKVSRRSDLFLVTSCSSKKLSSLYMVCPTQFHTPLAVENLQGPEEGNPQSAKDQTEINWIGMGNPQNGIAESAFAAFVFRIWLLWNILGGSQGTYFSPLILWMNKLKLRGVHGPTHYLLPPCLLYLPIHYTTAHWRGANTLLYSSVVGTLALPQRHEVLIKTW